MKAYYWRPQPNWQGSAQEHLRGPAIRNWGDELNSIIFDKLGMRFGWAPPDDAEMVCAGSILEHLPNYWAGTVAGAGKLHENSRIYLNEARVFALRGKLTAAGCVGLKDTPVFGDPALLMPRWIRQPKARYDLGVLGHWSDDSLRHRFAYGHVIDPQQDPVKVVQEIAACKRLVTSGLHGAIIADAYGIPRQLESPSDDPKEGGDFKFRDYASIYDESPRFGEMWLAPRDKVETIQTQLLEALSTAAGIDPSRTDPRHPQVSLLVPFRDDGQHRSRIWRWLRTYWRLRFPEAEIVQGTDHGFPFCKSRAVNHAARHARGRIVVILDADTYLDAERMKRCANRIDHALATHRREWLMPYNAFFRLNRHATEEILETHPAEPLPAHIPESWIEPTPNHPSNGHTYGAAAMMMPREAFEIVHGMDPRFNRGWGGEDRSFLRALDTLYAQHEVIPGDLLHFWHDKIVQGTTGGAAGQRRWVGQQWDAANERLEQRYADASNEPAAMQGLVDEHAGIC